MTENAAVPRAAADGGGGGNIKQLDSTLDEEQFDEGGTLKEQSLAGPAGNQHAGTQAFRQNEAGVSGSHNGSEEHETELRDLLVRALERNGVLSDLRAQVRSSVYTIIEQERQKLSPVNNGLTEVQQSIVDSLPNRISLALVRDFLQKLQLPYTQQLLEVELALDEIDIDPNSSVFLPEFGLPEHAEAQTEEPIRQLITPQHLTPADVHRDATTYPTTSPQTVQLPQSSSANTSNVATPQQTASAGQTGRVNIQDMAKMPVLSRLVHAKCLCRHRLSVETDFKQFLSNGPKLKSSEDILGRLMMFKATRHLHRDVLQAYCSRVLNSPRYSALDALESALLILKSICVDSAEVLSAEQIFNNPPTHEKLLSYRPKHYRHYQSRSATGSSAAGDSDIHNTSGLSNSLNNSTLNDTSLASQEAGDSKHK